MAHIYAKTALVLTFGVFVVFAYVSGEQSSGTTFAVGEVDIRVGNESYYNGEVSPQTSWVAPESLTVERFFNFTDVKPDDYGEDTISIQLADANDTPEDAYLCADVTLTSNNENGCTEPEGLVDGSCGDPGAGEGELADRVEFIWWADDGDNVLESDEGIISQGSLSELPLGVSTTVTLADSETNIWTGAGGPLSEGSTQHIGKAWCFGSIADAPFRASDDSDTPPNDPTNAGDPTVVTERDGGFTCAGTNLTNDSQTDSLTLDVSFNAVQALGNDGYQCGDTTRACTPEEEFADSVVSSAQGVRKNGASVAADRSDPSEALGEPESSGAPFDAPVVGGSFFSLGFAGTDVDAGEVVLAFDDNRVVDGGGADLRVWEVTGGTSYPEESVMVEVSQNGVDWFVASSSAVRDADIDIASTGLPWVRFVRLTDVTDPTPMPEVADAYDLDAVSALNCEVPRVPQHN